MDKLSENTCETGNENVTNVKRKIIIFYKSGINFIYEQTLIFLLSVNIDSISVLRQSSMKVRKKKKKNENLFEN